MKKLTALIVLIILIVGIGYLYNQNSKNIGVKIEKLKLKYAISPNSDPENILNFSEELKTIKTSSEQDSKILKFEQNYWKAVALNKKITKFLSKEGAIFSLGCSKEILELQKESNEAKESLSKAKALYNEIKEQYKYSEQENWNIKLTGLEKSIEYNNNLLFIICPEN